MGATLSLVAEEVARDVRATSDDWKVRADAAIEALADLTRKPFIGGRTFTAEDVRKLAGDPPHPNAMGSRFRTAVRRGVVVPVYWGHASRPVAHTCRLRHYQGVA